jgi:pimeloyl-ACP methyl ester carboxylesterase
MPADPRVRRAYFDCRYGQLHMNYAIPGGGGFDEATPLLCLPGAPGLGRSFLPLLAPLGRDRSVYAPDLPGCGESDPPTGRAGTVELAQALYDFLDSMHLRHVDLLAHDGGVAIAMAMIEMRPATVGRVVFSPASEAIRAEARTLRHPALVIDWPGSEAVRYDIGEIERQAAELRDFLGLP